VEHSQNDNPSGFHPEVNRKGKSAKHAASHVASDHRKHFGMISSAGDKIVDPTQKLLAKPRSSIVVPLAPRLGIRAALLCEIQYGGSSPESSLGLRLDFIPRHNVIRKSVVVRHAAVEFRPLGVRQREVDIIRTNAGPYLFDERQAVFDAQAIDPQRFRGNVHSTLPQDLVPSLL
jgi:hypothetical protein